MRTTRARAEHADHPPSTSGTPERRARRWPLTAGILAVGAIALAAPMVVAAEPAAAPTTEAITAARPADPVEAPERDDAEGWTAFSKLGDVTEVAGAATATAAAETPVPAPTTTTTTPPTTTAPPTTAPPTTAAPAPAAPSGRCGGDLPPCWVMMRESGGNITAQNPTSSASGKWQFINSTWAGFGGYAEAWMAPESVQDEKARIMWAGGAGCGHWSAC